MSTLKFDHIFNDLLNLVETDQMAYISFQQVEKGGQFSTLKCDPIYNYSFYISLTFHFNKEGRGVNFNVEFKPHI